MGNFNPRFIPAIFKEVDNPSNISGYVFRNKGYESKLRMVGNKFEFWIEDILIFSFNKNGIIDELGTDKFLPDQTGHTGKYLTTDGSVASWVALEEPTYNDRRASASITTGSNTITYSTTLGSTSYGLWIRCYDASGNNVNYTITSKAATGFAITVAENATIEYKAELY